MSSASEANLPILTCPACELPAECLCGHEVLGVYDGVLFWSCPCGHYWPRFAEGHPHHAAGVLHSRKASAADRRAEL